MIRNALTGEPKDEPKKTLAEQKNDFTAEGAPPPDRKTVPASAPAEDKEPTTPTPKR